MTQGNRRQPWIDDVLPDLLQAARSLWPTLDPSGVTVIRGLAAVPVVAIRSLGVRIGFDAATRTLCILDLPAEAPK